jgi:hypothetical protein
MPSELSRLQFDLLTFYGWFEGSGWPKGASSRDVRELEKRGWIRRLGRGRVPELTKAGKRMILDYYKTVLKATPPPGRKQADALDKRVPGSYGSRKGY